MHAFTERFSERLTERVVTHSLGEWKGREWKRKRSKIPRSGSSISSGSVPREPRLGMDGGGAR